MAELPMAEMGQGPNTPRPIGTLVNLVGAAASLALIVGAGVWGYKLLVRDVSGVPVVRAVEGPMRVQPDDPGGQQADHQGLSVNTVAADGSVAPPADRLTLAPAPVNLAEEDSALHRVSAPTGESKSKSSPIAKESTSDIVAPPPLSSDRIDAINNIADQIAGDAKPLSETDANDTDPVKLALGDVEVAKEETAPPKAKDKTPKVVFTNGVSHSLRPQLRPEGLVKSDEKLASLDGPVAMEEPKVIDAASIPVGTHLVQLGAFASEDIAAEEWSKLSRRFDDYLGDKTRVIQQAQSGGRVFYRLRAMGFADLSDARRLCSALKAERADCIPVTVR